MNINDVIATGRDNPSNDPDDMSTFIDELVTADDMTDKQRDVFCAGYMAGMTHALSIIKKTGDPGNIIGEMIAKEAGWESKDVQ